MSKDKTSDDKQTLPIVIHDDILSKIYNYYKDKEKNDTALAYGVYTFLYKTARIQNNIRVYANDEFIKKGTGIGRDKLKQIKGDLKSLELIDTIRPRIKGKYTQVSYIEVKYVWKPETIDKLFYKESSETTLYKIARELLLNNFDDFEEIKLNYKYSFSIWINGKDEEIYAEYFYFDSGLLKCTAAFQNGNEIDYTVPESEVGEVIKDLADSYKFNFTAISNVLQKDDLDLVDDFR